MRFAVIGTRKLSKVSEHFYPNLQQLCQYALSLDYEMQTGAAAGVDKVAARYYLEQGGKVHLRLPWQTFQHDWCFSIRQKFKDKVRITWFVSKAAIDSVDKYHPNPAALTYSHRLLHARNYEIIKDCSFVGAASKSHNDLYVGGTGQGVRIADALNIKVYNLNQQGVTLNDCTFPPTR